MCPDISEGSIERALHQLLNEGMIIKINGGRRTSYTKKLEVKNEKN